MFEGDIFLVRVVDVTFLVSVSGRVRITIVGCFYFAVEILKFITSNLHTDEREDFLCNYSSLISLENSDVEPVHVCHHISQSLRI